LNRQLILVKRPTGVPADDCFALVDGPQPEPAEGEFVIRNAFASMDPAMRGWLDDAPSYLPPVALGQAIRATTVGEVVRSQSPKFPVRSWVLGLNSLSQFSLAHEATGWTSVIDGGGKVPLTNYLSVLGTTGLTAYFGLLDIGCPKPGETVLVSGAAGAVGSIAGQIAKIKGCRVVGIAGGPGKTARLINDFGFDAAVDYKGKSASELRKAITAVAPKGIDVVFENVGGACLEAALGALNTFGRIVLCGMISEYNTPVHERVGTRHLLQLIVKSARMQGFTFNIYASRVHDALAEIAPWVAAGRIRFDEHIEEGLDRALPAFHRLFNGTNTGKMILLID
jgi:NADPH-dependent curcumin reductase CurA